MTGQLLAFLAQYDHESGESDPLRTIGAFVVAMVVYFGGAFVILYLCRMAKDFWEYQKKPREPKQRIYQEWEIKQIEEEERAKAERIRKGGR